LHRLHEKDEKKHIGCGETTKGGKRPRIRKEPVKLQVPKEGKGARWAGTVQLCALYKLLVTKKVSAIATA